MKDPKKVARGKKSRAGGAAFELRVRKDLESKGWIVDKWSNNVEFSKCTMKGDCDGIDLITKDGFIQSHNKCNIDGKLIPAKRKYAGPGRPMAIGTGFPDFIAFREITRFDYDGPDTKCEVIGVESKMDGKLKKVEKEKCIWLLDNEIFNRILIAEKTKVKNRVVIVYHDFEEKYGR